MTEISFPFASTSPGDAGPYSAVFFADVLRSMLIQELRANASVNSQSGDGVNPPLNVEELSTPGAAVRVRPGSAFVRGHYYANDDIEQLSIASNSSGNLRIDTISLEVDFANQTVRLKVIQGTPAAVPVPPSLIQNTAFWQVRIADVDVANLFSTITNAEIDNTVREYARLHPIVEGGTGLTAVVLGNMLMGTGSNILDVIPPPTVTPSWLVHNSAKVPPARWITMRRGMIQGSVNTNLGTSAAGTVLEILNIAENPDSFILIIGSNQFILASGMYYISTHQMYDNGSGAGRQAMAFIYNASAGTVLAQGPAVQTDAGERVFYGIPETLISSNGTDALELRGFANNASCVDIGVGALTPTGGVQSVTRQIYIRRVSD